MSDFKINMDMLVGKCAMIPTGCSRDEYIYKIVSVFESNGWCDVPIMHNSEIVFHNETQTVLNVIHCGVDETKVVRVALKDCKIRQPQTQADRIRSMTDEELADMFHNNGSYVENGEPKLEMWVKEKQFIIDDSFGCVLEWLQSEVEDKRLTFGGERMTDITEKVDTHIVIKKEDALKYLEEPEQIVLDEILNKISRGRLNDKKKPFNRYYICNVDEPYAEIVHGVIYAAEMQKKN